MGKYSIVTFVKIDPQEYVNQGFLLPLLSTKTLKRQNELCVDGRKLQSELCLNMPKQNPPPLSTKTPNTQNELCFDQGKLKRELCRNTSKQTLRNTFIRNPPFLYYQQKLHKHTTNSVLIGENSVNFVETRQNRPPSTIYKN